MKAFRKSIRYVFPVVIILMLAGLILSRIFTPDRTSAPEPEGTITASEAADAAGRTMTVCGTVADASFVPSISGEPTFLNFEHPHPDQIFTVVIWGEYRSLWREPPHQLYLHRDICVTGTIRMHEGVPQITVEDPQRIEAADH
jgi:hypothetical protein